MIKTFRKILACFILLLVMLATVPFLIPVDTYKSELEIQLSDLSNRKVMIGELHAQLLPFPAFSAGDINVLSSKSAGGELYINNMTITPRFTKLVEGQLLIKRIHIDGLAANQAFLQGYNNLLTSSKATKEQRTNLAIEEISASSMLIQSNAGKKYGPYHFTLRFKADNNIESLMIAQMDNKLHINMIPKAEGIATSIIARNWTVPWGPSFQFEKINAQGMLSGNSFEVTTLTTNAYNGHIQGDATISWDDHWLIDADLEAASVQMEPIIRALNGSGFDGHFNGKLHLTLQAQKASDLLKDYFVAGNFNITNGVVTTNKSQAPVFAFDSFSAYGLLQNASLSTSNAVLSAYSGKLTGDPVLSWHRGWQASGHLKADSIDTQSLLAGFIDHKVLSGEFNATAKVDLAANKFSNLFEKPFVNGDFNIKDGAIYKTGQDSPVLIFDKLTTHAKLESPYLDTKSIEINAYGGTITGTSLLTWQQDWHSSSELQASSIDMAPLLSGFVEKTPISGQFNGRAYVALTSEDFTKLLDNPFISGDFRMTDGIIHQADLEQASMNFSESGTTGGQTPFEILSGEAVIENQNTSLTKYKITSASLEAKGNLNISKSSELNGEMAVALRNASIVNIPMRVRGTTSEPNIRPTNSAMLGGAVGTSLMGPGLGTAIGIKVGALLGKVGNAFKGKKKTDD